MFKYVSFSSKKAIVFMLVFAFLCTSNLWSGITGKISGKVIDQTTGEPLPGANVMIEGTTMGISSDVDGFYFIINVPPREYSVTASYIGYEKMTKSEVMVMVDRSSSIDFALKPTVITGQAVTVVAERPVVDKDLTSSEQVISTEKIGQTWARSIQEVMETQTGVSQGHYRVGTLTETVYLLDNVSLNSGLVSDNYTGLNTSTIQEISVLTGGYNAEYGNAMSGIINIVTKESAIGIHGTVIGRMRPAGKYHWGRNIYSKENYDWKHFDLAYWTDESQNDESSYYGHDPNELLAQWQKQITPNDTLANYAERPEYETEVTLYGSATNKLNFLFSGRYKRGIGIFPQALSDNPEFNLQSKLTYKLTQNIKLGLNVIYGGYTTSEMSSSNYGTIVNARESAWRGCAWVRDPYVKNKYAPLGSPLRWPEKRRVQNYGLKLTHVLSPKTLYEINLSYLDDEMDMTDRDGLLNWDDPNAKWGFKDDEFGMLNRFYTQGYLHVWDYTRAKVYNIKGDLMSQVTKNHYIKTGLDLKFYDFEYEHGQATKKPAVFFNLMNVFDGKPYEGAFYAQDKIEFPGLVINAGLRLDFFNQNRNAPKNMFDPLAAELTTPGHDPNDPAFIPGDPEREKTKLQFALAPRVGVSHPIGVNTVLHFVYGHFYQRPSWNKTHGFAYITQQYNPMDVVIDPYDKQWTAMDQWQGYYGNPKLTYQRTIQYEIGLDQNVANLIRLDITGYYKDATNLTTLREQSQKHSAAGLSNVWTTLYTAHNHNNKAIIISNNVFTDIRGIEARLDTRFNLPLNFSLSYDLSYATGGVAGYLTMFELGTGVDAPQSFGQQKKGWNSNHKFKGIANLNLPKGFGPAVVGVKPLSDINVNIYFETWTGDKYTYHGAGDPSTKPFNKRWKAHYRTNLKIAKAFYAMGIRSEISMEIRNLFNNKDLIRPGGDNLTYYHENTNLTLEERLPKHSWSGEPNEWSWYNVWTNPPRQIYFQLKVDF